MFAYMRVNPPYLSFLVLFHFLLCNLKFNTKTNKSKIHKMNGTNATLPNTFELSVQYIDIATRFIVLATGVCYFILVMAFKHLRKMTYFQMHHVNFIGFIEGIILQHGNSTSIRDRALHCWTKFSVTYLNITPFSLCYL